ncbi:cytochrome P450 [Kitasatospora sp. NPDC006697]|uniref:cytochrome P450 family protein n=1 Tax=Kitasatospora sp. NPDC006697 TaxID=3364020 RepID=UPI0036924B5E
MQPQQLPEVLDLTSELFHVDQYATYRDVLEQRPVTRVRFHDGTFVWLVSRHDDVRAALGDARLSNDPAKNTALDLAAAKRIPADVAEYFHRNMFRSDEPDHGRLRKFVSGEFTMRRINALRPRIREITGELLDGFAGDRRADLVNAFAYPLSLTVICELLGVPEEDREDFRTWARHVVVSNPALQERHASSYRDLFRLVRGLVRRRQAEPGPDLLSALVGVRDSGDRLSEAEVVSMVFLLLEAGVETTVNMLGTGAFLLLSHPEQLARIRADGDLMAPAVEEVLRYMAPIEIATRHALEPLEIGGVRIAAHSTVMLNLAAANRDPARFADPQSFRITRREGSHLAFGHGIHFCLGAALARAEADTAFTLLLSRLPGLELAVHTEELIWRQAFLRGPVRLPVSWR